MSNPSTIVAPVSIGELIDKITILRIKSARVLDAAKLQNVRLELSLLEKTLTDGVEQNVPMSDMTVELQQVNELLWDVEDDIRVCDKAGDFGPKFIELARSVYRLNDRRCAIKRQINDLLSSTLIEEKSYTV